MLILMARYESRFLKTDLTSRLGGAIGFACTHAYPLTSSTIGEDLEKGLKGLDMLVYQALKHLAKSVCVVAMLDDEEYKEDMRMYRGSPEPEPEAPAGKVGGAKALLGKAPHSPLLWEDYEDDGDNGAEGSRAYGHCRRRKVTWMNGPSSNGPSKEFAIACLTVSGVPSPAVSRVGLTYYPTVWQ